MATRLPLASSGAAAVSPLFDPLWTQTTGVDRIRLSRAKRNTPLASKSVAESSALALNVLDRQYVSDPLAEQSIAGTVRMVARAEESHANADFRSQFGARVVSHDSLTTRGTLIAPDTTGGLVSEWVTALRTRRFPAAYPAGGATVSTVACQEGDRLVIEVGYRSHNLTTTSRTGTVNFGDPDGVADCPETEGDSGSMCPWLEFSADLRWLHNTNRIWVWPGFEVEFPKDEETGTIDRARVITAPSGTKRVVCGSDSWDVSAGETGDKIRPAADVPGRLAVG